LRSVRAGALSALFLLGTLPLGCGGSRDPLPIDRIVLVTIDTLRADHLPSFGYPLDTAPFLEQLASRGISFKRAYAQSATTGPAHASLFTSLYPMQHGVHGNGWVLDESFVTLAEVLSANGFGTAAFVSGNSHFRESQIAQGFQLYDQPPEETRNEIGRSMLYRRSRDTTSAVLEWLEGREGDDRFFLWVHYYDPHKPFLAPRRLVERATPADEESRQELIGFLEREHRSSFEFPWTLPQIHRYDAEIMYVDEEMERLFSAYEGLGLGSRTLWIVTSDHGQGLANHAWFGHHEQIYNTQLHVPLVFYLSDDLGRPREIDDLLVEHVDMAATILDALGLDYGDQPQPTQGRSLVPLLLGEEGFEPKEYVFAERRRSLRPSPDREPGERYALQSLSHKYFWFTEGEDEFYDLVADPYETTNLIDEQSEIKDEMRTILQQVVQALSSGIQARMVDEETLRRLRALGYVQ